MLRGHGLCRKCKYAIRREKNGWLKRHHRQVLGQQHIFPCGCLGVLPLIGENKFAKKSGLRSYKCRINSILCGIRSSAKREGFASIDPNTPHRTIRAMMERSCVFCGRTLNWSQLGRGKTPHLDHDHEPEPGTIYGKINGFACAGCNPRDLKNENKRLRKELMELKKEYTKCEQCNTPNRGGDECRECGADLKVEAKAA